MSAIGTGGWGASLCACLLVSIGCDGGACGSGDVVWSERAAVDLPESAGRGGRDWGLRLVGGGDRLALAGIFRDRVRLSEGDFEGAESRDSFVASYSTDGEPRWTRIIRGEADTVVHDIAIRSNGTVVAAGGYQYDVDLGGETCEGSASVDLFVSMYDDGGNVIWRRCLGGPGRDEAAAVAIDSSGDVFVAGRFGSPSGDPLDLGGGTLESIGNAGVFLAKLSGADGSHLWSQSVGSEREERVVALELEPEGDVILVGNDGAVTASRRGLFVARYRAADGALVWVSRPTPGAENFATDLAVDPRSGNPVVSAWSGSQVSATSYAREASYLLQFAASDGSEVWSWRQEFAGGFSALGMTATGDVLVAGDFAGVMRCRDSSSVASDGPNSDAMIGLASGADGSLEWVRRYGGGAADAGLGIVGVRSGRWIAAGYIDGTGPTPPPPFGDAEGLGVFLFEGRSGP